MKKNKVLRGARGASRSLKTSTRAKKQSFISRICRSHATVILTVLAGGIIATTRSNIALSRKASSSNPDHAWGPELALPLAGQERHEQRKHNKHTKRAKPNAIKQIHLPSHYLAPPTDRITLDSQAQFTGNNDDIASFQVTFSWQEDEKMMKDLLEAKHTTRRSIANR